MILNLEIHIDTTRKDTFDDLEEAIVSLLEAALSVVTVQTVVTVIEEDGAPAGRIVIRDSER